VTVRIVGIGKAVPARVLTNFDLEKMVETSNDWIIDRTGIHERRVAGADESAASLGAEASRLALASAAIDPETIDLVICATTTPDNAFPATASLIQQAIGCRHAGAFDINSACTGFIAAFTAAAGLINSGIHRRILIAGTDVMTRLVDWTDRATCILFGDGAGAVVLEASDHQSPESFFLKSDGSLGEILYARTLHPGTQQESSAAAGGYLVMDGREVYRVAVREMEAAGRTAIEAAGLCVEDISYVIPHQANQRIIATVAKNMGIPLERMVMNLAKYGNTSAASIPLAMCEAWEEGRLHAGDRLLLVAIGGGVSWGACVTEWTGIGTA
jgi:3-oxoacyl-[acyl-carrier-protein] synthase-3